MSLNIPHFNIDPEQFWSKQNEKKSSEKSSTLHGFYPVKIETMALKSRLSKKIFTMLEAAEKDGEEVNYSDAAYAVCCAMWRAKFTRNEILNVLTDRDRFILAKVGYKRRNSLIGAATWVDLYCLQPAIKYLDPSNDFKDERDSNSNSSNEDEEQANKNSSGEEGAQANYKLNLTFENFNEIQLDTSSSALIADTIDHGAACVVYGETNCGKTFFMIDMALCVALGKAWFQHTVERGAVLYIAAEGGKRIRERIIAFRKEHDLEGERIPFRLARGQINLLDPEAEIQALIEAIKDTGKQFGEEVRLVVVDTLSRALSGGDENDSADMGALVKNIDRIRNEVGAAVILVHHTGKNRQKGARGHTILKCAIDTEIEIKEDNSLVAGVKVAKMTKQRDYDCGRPFHFKLKQITLGTADSGKSITSCVVEPVIADFMDKPEKPITPNSLAAKFYEILVEVINRIGVSAPKSINLPTKTHVTTCAEWQKAVFEKHYKEKARSSGYGGFKSARKKLSTLQLIDEKDGYVWIL